MCLHSTLASSLFVRPRSREKSTQERRQKGRFFLVRERRQGGAWGMAQGVRADEEDGWKCVAKEGKRREGRVWQGEDSERVK